jgi:hypothetical protein
MSEGGMPESLASRILIANRYSVYSFTGTKVEILTSNQKVLSLYLLSWYTSTITDAAELGPEPPGSSRPTPRPLGMNRGLET